MSVAREDREHKRQLGQYLTPIEVARRVLSTISIRITDKVLEPSFGLGSFIYAYMGMIEDKGVDVSQWAENNLYGCELDHELFLSFKRDWPYGSFPKNIVENDFFRYDMPSYCAREYQRLQEPKYDLIIGNPPFGGTIDAEIQDRLDSIFGFRSGLKIKKETYAFFLVKCVDLLKDKGRLVFICSDTILSISTMKGLRKFLMDTCRVVVERLDDCFDDTKQPMIILRLDKGGCGVNVFGKEKPIQQICATDNLSWTINSEMARYFTGVTLGDYFVASSGMTVGCNEYFLREIVDGELDEPYEFELYQRPITLQGELDKARLGKLSSRKRRKIMDIERRHGTETALRVIRRDAPLRVRLPSKDYAPYNKATNRIVFAPPTCAIFWRNEGEAVYAYKKSGPWYLHGVGGKGYFKRSGLTWQLISSRLNVRYLPEGYILDSGSPCAFLRDGVKSEELEFVLGWCLTEKCNEILKTVINHTRNIQSKDFERLPYPVWVDMRKRAKIITIVRDLLKRAQGGYVIRREDDALQRLNRLFAWNDTVWVRRKSVVQSEFLL